MCQCEFADLTRLRRGMCIEPRARPLRILLSLACLGCFASTAVADDEPSEQPEVKPEKTKKKHKKLELTGRIFTRAALLHGEDSPDWTGQTTLQSARGGIDYRKHGVRAQLELEVASKARLKDAYAQLRLAEEPKLDVRAGNFKMPFSAIQLESIWTLPMADRGLVDNILTKRLQVAGRAVGAMVSADLGDIELRAGMFQGRNDAGDLLAATAGDGFGQDAVVRASFAPVHGLAVGASASMRSGALIEIPVQIERAYAAEVDVAVEQPVGPGIVRAWAEAMVGTSWLVGGMRPGHDLTRFLEARAIAAYRFGGSHKHDGYIEPYVLAGAVDPDRIITSDRVMELSGGLTYGVGDTWRVQLEAERWTFGANAPLGVAELAVLSRDSTTVLVQLGLHL